MRSATGHPGIDVAGVYNFRDLGGGITAAGVAVRTGLMFRSATLDKISAEGLATLETLGVRTVLDLRSTAEVDMHGRFPFERTGVRWVHVPAPMGPSGPGSQAPAPDHRDITEHHDPMALVFIRLVTEGGPFVAEVIRHLADPGNLPTVFHCTSGKDRTGLIAALIQLVIGRDLETVLVDFERSREYRDQIRTDIEARLSHLVDFTPEVLDRISGVDRAWLLDALELIGGPEGLDGWLDSIGVDAAVRESLRSRMVS
jgi:protein-tyrosine phosphatase